MARFHKSTSPWNTPDQSGNANSTSGNGSVGQEEAGSSYDESSPVSTSRVGFATSAYLASHRTYFLPLHYTATYEYPLVVWLHSNGCNENQIDDVMPYISVRNYVGVGIRGTKAADSAGHRFDWHGSAGAVAATHEAVAEAIDEAVERFSVHSSRIVLAGYREGGSMALRIAIREPDRFAGAISLGGRMPQGAIRNLEQLRQRRLPMLWQWGQANAQYTDENLKHDLRSAMLIGSHVEVRQYPGEDEMATVILGDVNDWIMRRIVSTSAIADSDRWSTSPTQYSSN